MLMRGAARLGKDWREVVAIRNPVEEEAYLLAYDRVMSDLERRDG